MTSVTREFPPLSSCASASQSFTIHKKKETIGGVHVQGSRGFRWELDESKFLTDQEVRKLRGVMKKISDRALQRGNKVAVRDWMIIDMAISTGLRVQELADLKWDDLLIDGGRSTVFVRHGKGNKPGHVRFGSALRNHILEYWDWRISHGEGFSSEDPFFKSSMTGWHMTKRALQAAFKRSMKKAGLRESVGIHSLRHTYGVRLYKSSGYNLRLVQKQLRHSSCSTTEVYAHVVNPDLDRAVEKLFG